MPDTCCPDRTPSSEPYCNHDPAAVTERNVLVCECGALEHGDGSGWTDPQATNPAAGQYAYFVQRDNDDGFYPFADEVQRNRYAALFPACTIGTVTVLDEAAADTLLADELRMRREDGESEWLCDACWTSASPGLVPSCQDGCIRPILADHFGPCDRRAWAGTCCTRCSTPGRLSEHEAPDS
jgi:hypothetical protein